MSKRLPLALSIVLGSLLGVCALYLPTKYAGALVFALAAAGIALAVKDARRVILGALIVVTPLSVGKAVFEVTTPASLTQGISLDLTDFLALAVIVLLASRSKENLDSARAILPALLPAAAWVALSALSLLDANESTLALIQLLIMVKLFLLFVVVASYLAQTGDLAPVLVGLAVIVALEALLGVYQRISGQSLGLLQLGEASTVAQQPMNLTSTYRVQGTLGHPNSYAMYLMAAIPLLFALLFCVAPRSMKLLAGGAVLLGAVGVLLSLSRSGWACLALALTVVMALAVWRKRLHPGTALLLASGMALAVFGLNLLMDNLIGLRLTSGDQGSAASRVTLAQTALQVVGNRPWLGVGLNNYRHILPHYGATGSTVVHNVYLLIAAETGVLGLAAFLLLLAVVLKHAWRLASRPADDAQWIVGAGACATLAGLVVWGITDYALLGAGLVTKQFWLLAALVSGFSAYAARSRAAAPAVDLAANPLGLEGTPLSCAYTQKSQENAANAQSAGRSVAKGETA